MRDAVSEGEWTAAHVEGLRHGEEGNAGETPESPILPVAGPRCTVRVEVAIEADAAVMEAFANHVAERLGLGKAYLFPTRIEGPDGVCEALDWCANGWTAEGVSIRLLASPKSVELVFGDQRRPRTFREWWGARGRVRAVDHASWQGRLDDATRSAW